MGYTRIFLLQPLQKKLQQHRPDLPEFTHHFFSRALKGIDTGCERRWISPAHQYHNNDYIKERQALTALNSLMV